MTKIELVEALHKDAIQDETYHLEKLNEARYLVALYERELNALRK